MKQIELFELNILSAEEKDLVLQSIEADNLDEPLKFTKEQMLKLNEAFDKLRKQRKDMNYNVNRMLLSNQRTQVKKATNKNYFKNFKRR